MKQKALLYAYLHFSDGLNEEFASCLRKE